MLTALKKNILAHIKRLGKAIKKAIEPARSAKGLVTGLGCGGVESV